jgi:hypothetical protein
VIKAIRRRVVELCLAVTFAIYLAMPDNKESSKPPPAAGREQPGASESPQPAATPIRPSAAEESGQPEAPDQQSKTDEKGADGKKAHDQGPSPCSFAQLSLRGFLILAVVKLLKLLKGKGGFHLNGTFAFALSFVAGAYLLIQCDDLIFLASLGWAAFLAIASRYIW